MKQGPTRNHDAVSPFPSAWRWSHDFLFLAFEDERIARQRLVESACYFQASQVERAEESIHDPVETISGTTRTGWTSELIKRVVYLEVRHPDIDEIWSFLSQWL